MLQCHYCFALNAKNATHCRTCHVMMSSGEASTTAYITTERVLPPLARTGEAVVRPAQRTFPGEADHAFGMPALNTRYRRPTRNLRYYLTVALLLGASMVLSATWKNQGDAMELSNVASPLQQQEMRRDEIRLAANAMNGQLGQLETHLRSRSALSDLERNRWMALWQDELQDIKGRFHAWGTVDSRYPDARAENALRNALLYLYSMQHVSVRERAPLKNAEYLRLRKSFEQSVAAATSF